MAEGVTSTTGTAATHERAPEAGARPPRRRRLSPALRTAEIVDAATRLIAEHGFNGTSLQDVADACGLTVPGVLHHVPSKDALLVAVLHRRDELDRAACGLDLRPPGAPCPREILDAVVRRHAGQREMVRLHAVLSAEAFDPQHPAHAYFERQYTDTLHMVTGLLAEDWADPQELARELLATMEGAQLHWLRFGPGVDLVELWGRVADAIFARARRRCPTPA